MLQTALWRAEVCMYTTVNVHMYTRKWICIHKCVRAHVTTNDNQMVGAKGRPMESYKTQIEDKASGKHSDEKRGGVGKGVGGSRQKIGYRQVGRLTD